VSILDAVTRALGVPFSAVVGCVPEAAGIRRSPAEVRYGVVITAGKSASELWSAIKYRLYGFEQCKLKVGIADRNDATSLARIRWLLPRHKVDLRVDANEAWTLANVEAKTAALLPYGITALEQPVPDEQAAGLAPLRSRLGVPIMLDESLCSLGDARRAIEQQNCDLFNIRLSKCGGFVDSLKIAALAREAGLGYQLGCLVGETGILSAAGRHFATAVDHIRYLEGSYDRHLVAEPLTREDLTFGFGGRAPRLEGPGLGITIDEGALDRVKVAELHFSLGRGATTASPANKSQTVGIGDV
jgi:muconate cycloisomerase